MKLDRNLSDLALALPGYNADALAVPLAQELILSAITPITEFETLPLKQALGRILANDLISPIAVPSFDNSAMDGYAFRGSDLGTAELKLHIVGKAYAGHPFPDLVQSGECVRIMTGAVIPRGCDTVIPQEFTRQISATEVMLSTERIQAGDNRRLVGEDLAAGTPALHKGKQLSAADLGLIASLGVAQVAVMRKLRVAFFSTGDELRSIGQPLDPGCVYDSNRYTLHGMLTRAGCEAIDLGVVPDDPAALEAALSAAASQADAVITTGGVSAGDADYTQPMMARLGEVLFWKIAMRPGRPMAFGKLKSGSHTALLFGLPGNPVAVMATFYFFARAALWRLMGANIAAPLHMKVACAHPIRKRAGRTEFQRGVVSLDTHGRQTVRITGAQGSGILSSMSEANCMIMLSHEQTDLAAGAVVDVIPFEGLL
jgi:molybdopterin molybdotransferase